MPAELIKDLFYLQPNNSKRRFQQYILSYVVGIEISLEGLNTEKIRILKNFVEEINSMLSAEVISPIRTQLHLLDPRFEQLCRVFFFGAVNHFHSSRSILEM